MIKLKLIPSKEALYTNSILFYLGLYFIILNMKKLKQNQKIFLLRFFLFPFSDALS